MTAREAPLYNMNTQYNDYKALFPSLPSNTPDGSLFRLGIPFELMIYVLTFEEVQSPIVVMQAIYMDL